MKTLMISLEELPLIEKKLKEKNCRDGKFQLSDFGGHYEIYLPTGVIEEAKKQDYENREAAE